MMLRMFISRSMACATAFVLSAALPTAQQAPTPKNWTAAEDHQNMMEQLGIKALRPGPSGNEQAPNHANYDEATANPYPESARRPDAEERQKVTTRGHVVEAAPSRDRRGLRARGLGRVPKNVPKVTWTVASTDDAAWSADRRSSASSSSATSTTRRYPRHHRGHPDDAGHAGRRRRARCR